MPYFNFLKCFGKTKNNTIKADSNNSCDQSQLKSKSKECSGARETRFSSTQCNHTSNARCSDACSTSIGCWSSINQIDGCDTSHFNVLINNSLSTPLSETFYPSRDEFRDAFEALVSRLEQIAKQIRVKSPGLIVFESFIDNELRNYMTLSEELGGDIKAQSICVLQAFDIVKRIIEDSYIYCKPSDAEMDVHCAQLYYKLADISNFSLHVNFVRRDHLNVIGNSILILLWIRFTNAAQFTKEIKDSAQVNSNRVFQNCQESCPKHVKWIRAWFVCLNNMCALVDEHYPHGLSNWNPTGPKYPISSKSTITHTVSSRPNQSQTLVCKKTNFTSVLLNQQGKAKSGDDRLPSRNSINMAQLLEEIQIKRQQLRHVDVLEC